MSKIIDVILSLKDQMTAPMERASKRLQANARNFKRAGRDIQNVGRHIEGVGSTLTRSVTLPVVGAGAAAIKAAADFEQGMADVGAISNATGKQIKMLSDKAKSMEDLGFSATEVTEAYKYMGMAGWKAKEMLAGAEPIMKLAAATNTELGATSDIVTDALTAFGAKAEDTSKLTDIFTKTVTNSNTDINKLGETFKYAAPVAGAFNYSMSETATMAGLMANAGIKASQAGTTLRTTMTNLLAPTDANAKRMAELGLNAEELSKMPLQAQLEKIRGAFKGMNNEQKAVAAKAIAGKNAMSGLLAIVSPTDKEFRKFTKTIKDSDGATDKMFNKTMNTAHGRLKKLKSALKNTAADFGELMLPTFKKVVAHLTIMVKHFRKLSEEQKKNILKWVAIAAVIGPVLSIFGKVTMGIGGFVKMIGSFGGALSKFGSLMGIITSPAGIVIGILIALAGAVAFVIKHWDKLKASVIKCFDAVKPIIDAIKKVFSSLFDTITGGSTDASDTLINVFKVALDAVADVLNLIAPIVERVVKVVGKILEGAIGFVKKVFERLKKFYYDHKEVIDTIAKIIGVIIETLVGVVSLALDVISGAIDAFFEGLFIMFDTLVAAVEGVCSTVWGVISDVWDSITGVFDGIKETLGGIIDFIAGVFTLDWERAWEGVKSIFTGIWDAMCSIVTGAINAIVGVINALIDAINWLTGWIPELFGGEHDWIPNIPTLATGTDNWRGGIVQISEKGGEIVDLPSGARVYPHDDSVKKAYQDGLAQTNSNTVTINIPKIADQLIIREDADIPKIAKAIANELEAVSLNLGANDIHYRYQN